MVDVSRRARKARMCLNTNTCPLARGGPDMVLEGESYDFQGHLTTRKHRLVSRVSSTIGSLLLVHTSGSKFLSVHARPSAGTLRQYQSMSMQVRGHHATIYRYWYLHAAQEHSGGDRRG